MIFQPPHALGFHFQIGVCGVTTEFFSLEYSLQIQYRTWELGKRKADFNAGTVEFHFNFLVGLLGLSKNRVASNFDGFEPHRPQNSRAIFGHHFQTQIWLGGISPYTHITFSTNWLILYLNDPRNIRGSITIDSPGNQLHDILNYMSLCFSQCLSPHHFQPEDLPVFFLSSPSDPGEDPCVKVNTSYYDDSKPPVASRFYGWNSGSCCFFFWRGERYGKMPFRNSVVNFHQL